jgi:hypothetical protein
MPRAQRVHRPHPSVHVPGLQPRLGRQERRVRRHLGPHPVVETARVLAPEKSEHAGDPDRRLLGPAGVERELRGQPEEAQAQLRGHPRGKAERLDPRERLAVLALELEESGEVPLRLPAALRIGPAGGLLVEHARGPCGVTGPDQGEHALEQERARGEAESDFLPRRRRELRPGGGVGLGGVAEIVPRARLHPRPVVALAQQDCQHSPPRARLHSRPELLDVARSGPKAGALPG